MIVLSTGSNEVYVNEGNFLVEAGDAITVKFVQEQGLYNRPMTKTAAVTFTIYDKYSVLNLSVVSVAASEDLPNGSVHLDAGYEGKMTFIKNGTETYVERFKVI